VLNYFFDQPGATIVTLTVALAVGTAGYLDSGFGFGFVCAAVGFAIVAAVFDLLGRWR
jgi:hypothetical protein